MRNESVVVVSLLNPSKQVDEIDGIGLEIGLSYLFLPFQRETLISNLPISSILVGTPGKARQRNPVQIFDVEIIVEKRRELKRCIPDILNYQPHAQRVTIDRNGQRQYEFGVPIRPRHGIRS